MAKPWVKGQDDGVVVELANAITDGTVSGWFIPGYTQKAHPELVTVQDVVDHPKYFPDPEEADKGRLYSCPSGWACEISTAALFEAYDMDATWNLFSPSSGDALDASIARVFTREKPILLYYWGPTSILGKYDAVILDTGPADQNI